MVKIKKIEFNDKIYISNGRRRNSFGFLARDMIQEYVCNKEVSFGELKEKLSSKLWINPWKNEVIVKTFPKEPDQYYIKEEEKIKLSDEFAYVARYWTSHDVIEMAKLLGSEIKILA